MSWTVVKVEDLAGPQRYSLSTGPFGSAISAQFFRSTGVPVIRGSNLSNDVGTRLSDDGLVFIDPELALQFARSVARRGDLVFTCWGTIDQVGLIDRRTRYDEYVVSNKQMKLTPDPRKADALFLYYYFSSEEVRESIVASGIGSSVPGFNLGQLRSMEVPLPPLDEQRAIAEVLGALDDKIELNRQINHTLEEMASALFRSWFIDFDPVVARAEGRNPFGMDAATAALFPAAFENTELGVIPAGWRATSVGPCVAEVFDGPHATPPDASSGAVFLGISNMTGTSLDLRDARYIAESDWARWTRRVTPREGDIVFTYEAALGRFALMPAGLRCCLGRRMALVRARSLVEAPFLFHQFVAAPFQEVVAARSWSGSTVDRTPLTEFPSYPLLWPGEALVRRFSDAASPMWSLIHHGQEESRTLAALRDALLPKLLTGEVRLKQAEKAVEAAV